MSKAIREWLIRKLGGAPLKSSPPRDRRLAYVLSDRLNEKVRQRFERAFSDGGGGSVRQCVCGREFYNSNGGWDWNDGELELLRAKADATDLPWAVSGVYFEGQFFVADCDCWTARAARIVGWIRHHDHQIVTLLKLDKQAAIDAAQAKPVVLGD